jgi:hypothetical protein
MPLPEGSALMLFLIFCGVLYFLPSIIGHDRRAFTAIFLLNFFLGWTVIGWVIALVLACTSETHLPMYAVAGGGRYCCRCGAPSAPPAYFCWSCGSRI